MSMMEDGFEGSAKGPSKKYASKSNTASRKAYDPSGPLEVVGWDLDATAETAAWESAETTSSTPEGEPCPGLSRVYLDEYEAKIRQESFEDATLSASAAALNTGEFGPDRIVQEKIIGLDDRVLIADTSVVPYRRICYLSMTTSLGYSFKGTGWLIGPRVLVTAGHCVYNREHAYGIGKMRSVKITVARNGQFNLGTANATRVETTQGWISNGDEEWDFGVVFLDQPLGNQVGFFGFANYPDNDLKGKLVNVVGYPGEQTATMWGRVDKIVGVSSQRLEYLADTTGGQSGCPVIYNDGSGTFRAVGIHNYGGNQGNFATRINDAVFQQLKKWKTQGS